MHHVGAAVEVLAAGHAGAVAVCHIDGTTDRNHVCVCAVKLLRTSELETFHTIEQAPQLLKLATHLENGHRQREHLRFLDRAPKLGLNPKQRSQRLIGASIRV